MLGAATIEELRRIAEEYNLGASEEELQVYSSFVTRKLGSLKLLEDWQLPDVKPEYEERKFYRPKQEENAYNAWYYKCSISCPHAPSKSLAGCKVAFKDNISIAMAPMMNGSKILEGFVPDQDATVVKRILDHGGTIVGSTTCESLCMSGASYNTAYGPVRNPWNQKYSAGGSSSGSGVVVATGEADMALGCDQSGSIRIPASSCGIVGLKPTYGLVPYTGMIPLETTLDHAGPMARSVTECARLLNAIAGFDQGKDFRQPSCGFQQPDFLAEALSAKPGTLRIGILEEGFHQCTDEVLQCMNNAVPLIKASKKFLSVDQVSMPDHDKALVVHRTIATSGIKNQLLDGYGYGTGLGGILDHRLVSHMHDRLQSQAHTLPHMAKRVLISTTYLKKNDGMFYQNYAKAQTLCYMLKQQYEKLLQSYDVLLMPTLPKLPAKIPGVNTPIAEAIANSVNMIRNTGPFDITHLPALSLNAGYDDETGLPIGLQLVGRLWDDATVLKAAKLIEEVLAPLQKPFPFM